MRADLIQAYRSHPGILISCALLSCALLSCAFMLVSALPCLGITGANVEEVPDVAVRGQTPRPWPRKSSLPRAMPRSRPNGRDRPAPIRVAREVIRSARPVVVPMRRVGLIRPRPGTWFTGRGHRLLAASSVPPMRRWRAKRSASRRGAEDFRGIGPAIISTRPAQYLMYQCLNGVARTARLRAKGLLSCSITRRPSLRPL
jgi:hypothetical protein